MTVPSSLPGVPLTSEWCQWLRAAHLQGLVSLPCSSCFRVNTEMFSFTAASACVTRGAPPVFQWVTHLTLSIASSIHCQCCLTLGFNGIFYFFHPIPPHSPAQVGHLAPFQTLLQWSHWLSDQSFVSMNYNLVSGRLMSQHNKLYGIITCFSFLSLSSGE